MTWVKLDDGFTDHGKVDGLTDGAFRLHVSAMCYSARNLTDGAVDRGRPIRLVPRFKQAFVTELVAAGLWDVVDGGWSIHDYLKYNPSRAQVLAQRDAAAERQRKVREKSQRQSRRDSQRSNSVSHTTPSRPEGSRDGAGFTGGEAATTALAASGSAVESEEEPLGPVEATARIAEIRQLARRGAAS